MRPDRLSYVICVDNRLFTRPRRLLRPINSDTPCPDASVTPTSSLPSSPATLRRSLRLQSRAASAQVQTSISPLVKTFNTSPHLSTWLLSSSATDRASSTRSISNNSSRSTSENMVTPLALPRPLPSMLRMRQRGFHSGPTPLLSFLHIMLSSQSHACFLAI